MSPMLDLQRRLVEVGRVRLGMKKTSQNGKSYPAKLEQFRLTSRDRQRLDAAAALYGGEVKKWDDQWELFTETDVLPIAVVPGQALTQAYELWGQKTLPGGKKSAVICLRRCDSVTEAISGRPCLCADEDEMSCKPTTRLSVVLTEVPGLGVWRCEVHGWNAAMELAGSVQLLESLVASGRPVRARLRLDKREKKTETETRNFVVPVLDIDHTLGQVLDAIGAGAPTPAIEQRSGRAIEAPPGFTPVPAAIEAPSTSIADQVAQPLAKTRRSNAAEPIKKSGRRTRAEVVDGLGEAASTGGEGGGSGPSLPSPSGSPGGEHSQEIPVDTVESPDGDSGAASPPGADVDEQTRRAQQLAMSARDAGLTDDQRHAVIGLVTGGRTQSGKDLDDVEYAQVRALLVKIRQRHLRVVTGVDGTVRLDEPGEPSSGAGSDDDAFWPVDRWKTFVKEHGKTQVATLRYARTVAQELGIEAPSGFAEWQDGRISAAVRQWVEGEAA